MLTNPIVEGAYYEREDGQAVGPAAIDKEGNFRLGEWRYNISGALVSYALNPELVRLTRRVYIVPTDPAEVVAELRERASINCGTQCEESELEWAADLVAKKLGVERE